MITAALFGPMTRLITNVMIDSRSAAQAVAYSAIENVRPYEVTRGELITALSSGAGDTGQDALRRCQSVDHFAACY